MINLKKAFTLLEILIVVIIVWFLMSAIWKLFTYKDIDRLKFDTCYIKIYSSIDKFFQEAITQKWVYTGWTWQSVSWYNISFNPWENKITLIYSWTWVEKVFILNSLIWEDDKNWCYTKTYHTLLSWGQIEVKIKPWLEVDNSSTAESAMMIYSWWVQQPNWSNATILFLYCPNKVSNSWCLEKYKIKINSKSYLFKSYFCKTVDKNDWHCITRSE